MASRLLKKIPATVVTAPTQEEAVELFSIDEYQRLAELRDRFSSRNQVLLQLDEYRQYERLIFLRWLVRTGRVER